MATVFSEAKKRNEPKLETTTMKNTKQSQNIAFSIKKHRLPENKAKLQKVVIPSPLYGVRDLLKLVAAGFNTFALFLLPFYFPSKQTHLSCKSRKSCQTIKMQNKAKLKRFPPPLTSGA
jgi:hypothetical protein